uniref:BRCT domain-containing protein n=14 Tax=Triticinae TaxID=1648030 RepID=A0A452YZL8_AEGTS
HQSRGFESLLNIREPSEQVDHQMGRPRKTKAKAGGAEASSPALSIGNCKVEIHGSGLRCVSTEQNLTISGTRGAKILITVDGARSSSDGTGEGSDFILLNPNEADSLNKSLLQEVLRLYKKELPTMDYAADTGRKSGFLEKCIMNGKYKTLILRPSSLDGPEEIIAAVSYQIVPADTQYAEIPLAAVTSPFQRVGFGHLLYKELSQRLHNVGVTNIFCWADKVSEGFWLKQGFVSVGEVDTKGKIRRIPVRADIKRALCFPGSSTLMVTHIKKDLPTMSKNSLAELQTSQLHAVVPDSISPGDMNTVVPSCEKLSPQTTGCHKVSKTAKVVRNEASAGSEGCSLSDQQPKKRTYESSSSSLKSKRVRCSGHTDHTQDMRQNDICDKSLTINSTPLTPSMVVHVDNKISGDAKATTCSNGRPSVMLMNIADETKKTRLTEVVETLGGVVTCEGSSCTHVVTGKARRTMNFCIALSSGAWIVSPNWLKQSFKQGKFVGEAEHVLDDEEYKMKYKSEMRDAVMRAKERPCLLFSGYTFCLTKHIEPSPGVLSPVIKSSGGKIISKLDEIDEPSKTIFLACEEGMELAMDAAKRGIKTFSSEWLMTCVMRQEVDLDAPPFAESL